MVKKISIGVILLAISGVTIYVLIMLWPKSVAAPVRETQQESIDIDESSGRPCTMEAKLCPDGSSVGRQGPDCEFEACPGGKNTFWRSQPQGDFVPDTRDPNDVCLSMKENEKLNDCNVLKAKSSNNPTECVGGMSVAGCFACQFQCPYDMQPINGNDSDDTSDWKLYRNKVYGFSLKYPSELFLQENDDLFEKMCQTEYKLESAQNDFTNTQCIDSDFIAVIKNNDYFCTKGGCVDKRLKSAQKKGAIFGIHIRKTSPEEKKKLISEWMSQFEISQEIINETETYQYIVDETFPSLKGFYSSNGQMFMIYNATETGSREIEESEINTIKLILSTLETS